MLNFREYIKKVEEQNTVGTHNDGAGGPFRQNNGAYTDSSWTGSETGSTGSYEGHPPHLPSPEIVIQSTVPTVKKVSKILTVEKNTNPIFVHLKDGTRLYFTIDEFRRIKGNPAPGKIMTVVFQRAEFDKSNEPSQVQSARVD